MKPSPSELRIAFSNALRAFQTGELGYGDFLVEIDRQRTAGASPEELLAVLQRREYVEPLSDPVHEAVVAHLLLGVDDSRDGASYVQPYATRGSADGPVRAMSMESWQGADLVAMPGEVDPSLEITSPIVPAALQHHESPELRSTLEPISEPRRPASPATAAVLGMAVLLGVGGLLASRARLTGSGHPAPAQPVPAATVRSEPAVPRQAHRAVEAGMRILDCPGCPEMVVLPIGQFTQGSGGDRGELTSSEMPPHRVTIGYLLALAASDVTVAEFRQFVSATGRDPQGHDIQGCDTYDGEWRARRTASWLHPGFSQTGSHPVTCVSWNDAQAYAQWITQKSGHRYRLPSAAEWEYAAQSDAARSQSTAGNGSPLCAFANVADLSAARRYPGWNAFNCEDGFVHTSPVGTYTANAFGLSDMLGNVYQWTEDCWHPDYAGAPIDGSARTSGNCAEHELRGGSWFSSPQFVRSAARNHFAADYRTSSVGFRLARDVN